MTVRWLVPLWVMAGGCFTASGEVVWTGARDGSGPYHSVVIGTYFYPYDTHWEAGEVYQEGVLIAPSNWSTPTYPDSPETDVYVPAQNAITPGHVYPPAVGSTVAARDVRLGDAAQLEVLLPGNLQVHGDLALAETANVHLRDGAVTFHDSSIVHGGHLSFTFSHASRAPTILGTFTLPPGERLDITGFDALFVGDGNDPGATTWTNRGESNLIGTPYGSPGGWAMHQSGTLINSGRLNVQSLLINHPGGFIDNADGELSVDGGRVVIRGRLQGGHITTAGDGVVVPGGGVMSGVVVNDGLIRFGNSGVGGDLGDTLFADELNISGAGHLHTWTGGRLLGTFTVPVGETLNFSGGPNAQLFVGDGNNPSATTWTNQGESNLLGTPWPVGWAMHQSGNLVNTGRLNVQSLLISHPGATIDNTDGELHIDGVLRAADLDIANGTLSGSGIIEGNVHNTLGKVAPGSSPGILTITGDFELGPLGSVELEIGGLLAGQQHDQLAVGGDANLDGEVLVLFVGGFTPQVGDDFSLFEVGGLFDDAGATYLLPPGISMELIGPGDYRITAVPEPAAISCAMALLLLVGKNTRARKTGQTGERTARSKRT